MTAFLLGFLLGTLLPLALAVTGACLLVRGGHRETVAKFLRGVALILAHEAKPPAPSANGKVNEVVKP